MKRVRTARVDEELYINLEDFVAYLKEQEEQLYARADAQSDPRTVHSLYTMLEDGYRLPTRVAQRS